MQVGYEVYVSITTYYSSFKQDTGRIRNMEPSIVKPNHVVGVSHHLYSSTISQPLARSNALVQPRRNAWRSVVSMRGVNCWPTSRSASIS